MSKTDEAPETAATAEAGELAHVALNGRWYAVHKTRCATCRRAILIASRGPRSAVYDCLTIDPLHGPRGDRHACSASRGRHG